MSEQVKCRYCDQPAILAHQVAGSLTEKLCKNHSAPSGQGASSEKDWTEDFSHENGNYQNRCVHCEAVFLGHKRRVCCKTCAKPLPAPSAPADDEVKRKLLELYPAYETLTKNYERIVPPSAEGVVSELAASTAKAIFAHFEKHYRGNCEPAYGSVHVDVLREELLAPLVTSLTAVQEEIRRLKLTVNVSYQQTTCCVCGVRKHTPVRNDNLGGYICGGCLEKAYEDAETRAEKAEAEVSSLRSQLSSKENYPSVLSPDGRPWACAFKNFHWNLCKRFGYCHDDIDWYRDLASLEEFIAAPKGEIDAK